MTDFWRETFLISCRWKRISMNPIVCHQESGIQKINREVREVQFPVKGRPIIKPVPKHHFVWKHNQVTNFQNDQFRKSLWFLLKMIWYNRYPGRNPTGTEITSKETRGKVNTARETEWDALEREVTASVCMFLSTVELILFCINQDWWVTHKRLRQWGEKTKRVRGRKRRG